MRLRAIELRPEKHIMTLINPENTQYGKSNQPDRAFPKFLMIVREAEVDAREAAAFVARLRDAIG